MSVAITGDGKILVAGYTPDGVRERILLVRYTSSGSLDASFGTAGLVITPYGEANVQADGMALQDDGRIVLVGHSATSCVLLRYATDGALDATFGASGTVEYGTGGANCRGIAIQPDGKIIAGRLPIMRFSSNGQPDAGFAMVRPVGPSRYLALQSDGRILFSDSDPVGGFFKDVTLFVDRLTPDGARDSTFVDVFDALGAASDGFRDAGGALAIQRDGKIIVAEDIPLDPRGAILLRLNTDGTIDQQFGNAGVAASNLPGRARSIVLQSNGRIIAAGGKNDDPSPGPLQLTRFEPNGTLDKTFGVGGLAATSFFDATVNGTSIALQADGRIAVVGHYQDVLMVTRYFGDPAPGTR